MLQQAPSSSTLVGPVSLLPSEWVRFAIRVPLQGKGLVPFSFKGREYLLPIYDQPDKRVLLCFGRQTEKSTSVGNKMLALASLIRDYKILYVSPSQTQTRTFSQDRIAQPLLFSPRIQDFLGKTSPDNVHEKGFPRTRSSIRLRYAYLNPERIRGIPADMIVLDELQDVFADNVPVIEETLSHSLHPTHAGWMLMSGTPKSLDNTLSYYWTKSSQSELVVPCERHGFADQPGTWHWIRLGEENIGRHGLICEKCGALVNRFHPRRGWVDMVTGNKIKGYRLPQMLAPTVRDHEWEDKVLYKYETYPRPQFFNEVMAVPWEAGIRPISQGELMACCDPNWTMARDQVLSALSWHAASEIYAGIDYGLAEKSWTVLALGTYRPGEDKFRIFYLHRFTGLESTQEAQAQLLKEILHKFNVRVSFADWGVGFHQNNAIMKDRGPSRHNVIQYVAQAKKRFYYNPNKQRWIGERRDLMAGVLNALKNRMLILPAWSAFETYGTDILNITTEFNKARQQMMFDHHPSKPDDSFHAILYCLLAANLLVPRLDIFSSIDPKTAYEGVRTHLTYD